MARGQQPTIAAPSTRARGTKPAANTPSSGGGGALPFGIGEAISKLGEQTGAAVKAAAAKAKAEKDANTAWNSGPTAADTFRDIDAVQAQVNAAGKGVKQATGAQADALLDRARQPAFGAPSITQPGGLAGLAATVGPSQPQNYRDPNGVLNLNTGPGGLSNLLKNPTGGRGTAPPPAPPAFAAGQQLARGALTAAPGSVASQFNPNVATAANAQTTAGSFGADPSTGVQRPADVAGRLGAGPAVGNVANVAGRLGAAPQVGQVGNIQMGSAPGAIAGQLGNMGQSSAGQQNMLSRIEGFLDSPEGPSVAEAQLRQAQSDNMGNLMSAARSGRGGAGSQVDAMRGAISEGGALASDTAGQMATLRAQEQDMLKNRQLSAMGLGGELATQQRAGDLSFRGQDLSALQGDQSTSLGARGQDLSAAQSNQGTQLGLEQLSAQTALGARGQDLSALQGDQTSGVQLADIRARTDLGARGQDLSALQGDQATSLGFEDLRGNLALGARGQNLQASMSDADRALAANRQAIDRDMGLAGMNLSALQGDQATSLTARGQNNERDIAFRGQDVQTRDQDRMALTADADRTMAAQDLNLRRELGLTDLGLEAQNQGLTYEQSMQGMNLAAQGMATDYNSQLGSQMIQLALGNQAADNDIRMQNNAINAQPSFWEKAALGFLGKAGDVGGAALGTAIGSDERAKTDISPLDKLEAYSDSPANDLIRESPGYSYRYTEEASGPLGEDSSTEHWGPMAQDLEKSPIGRSLVKERDGIKMVDVGRLALTHHAALHSMRNELDALRKYLEEDAA